MTTPVPIDLPDADATDALARQLAGGLRAGDALLLSGPTGAGKSHLARGIIQTLQRNAGTQVEDVPSPTFTLVQTYWAGPLQIWHCDLYRLGDSSELEELGLPDAWDSALTLIEWPDRLGPDAPTGAIHLTLRQNGEGRLASFTGPKDRLDRILREVDW